MALSIRPVTRRFPASFELWEETNLPLAVVLQPLDETASTHADEDHEEHSQQGSSATAAQRRKAAAMSQQQSSQSLHQQQSLPLLTQIPKCLHCGAPHPDARTHYSPPRNINSKDHQSQQHISPLPTTWGSASSSSTMSSSCVLFCYLCGKVSSTRLDEQIMARRHEIEGGGGASAAAAQTTRVEGQGHYRRLPSQPSHTFALPLRLPSSSASLAPQHSSMYQIPAMSCPPLWFWILDGTATDRSYWHVVSETLQTCLTQLPPFCHVALILACRQDRGVGIFRLDSATPHVKYYPYAAESSSLISSSQQNNPIPSHAHDGLHSVNGDHHHSSSAADAAANEEAVLLLRQRIMQSLVPCDGSHRDHIQAALRSLLDVHSLVESDTVPAPSASAADPRRTNAAGGGMPLAELLTHLSEALLTFGQAAGQKPLSNSDPNDDTSADEMLEQEYTLLPYAGGKVTVFLANRPSDLPHHAVASYYNSYLARDDLPLSSLYTYGGLGGRTASSRSGGSVPGVGRGGDYYSRPPQDATIPFYSDRTSTAGHGNVEKDEQDLEKLSDFFAELGRQCADAAMGIDILGLVSSLTNGIDNQDKDLGLVVVGGLSYKSGAAGPLLFDLHQPEARRNLMVEVSSRSPWIALNNAEHSDGAAAATSAIHAHHQRVFGAELRLRLSQGFTVDDAAIEPPPPSTAAGRSKKKKQVKQKQHFYDGFDDDNGNDDGDYEEDEDSMSQPFLACLHGEKGLMGPACAVPDEDSLWRMGTCDPYTAFSIDLDMAGSIGGNKKTTASTIPQDVMVDGWGRIPLKAVMQTCFAYTTIIKGNDDGEYYTVRRMKISSCPVPLAHDAETIYNAVDPEATAVILFHKLTVASFQEGLQATKKIATDWLQSLLTCAYRSAETQAEIEFEMKESGIEKSTPPAVAAATTTFLQNERLIHQDGGTLSDEDVLLAQGHARLKSFPLMIYLLLQCDAFRRHQELSSTTALSSNMDLRYAALYQMAHMTPDVLTRCIGPMLQLWSAASGAKKNRLHDGDYGDEQILDMIDRRASAIHQSIKEYSNNPSSSSLILFMDTPYQMLLLDAKAVLSTQDDNPSNRGGARRQSTTPVVGPALATAVQEAASRYRTRPPMIRALDINSTKANESSTTRAVQQIWDACLEDVASEGDTFAQWKSKMAEQVLKELEEDEEYQDDGVV